MQFNQDSNMKFKSGTLKVNSDASVRRQNLSFDSEKIKQNTCSFCPGLQGSVTVQFPQQFPQHVHSKIFWIYSIIWFKNILFFSEAKRDIFSFTLTNKGKHVNSSLGVVQLFSKWAIKMFKIKENEICPFRLCCCVRKKIKSCFLLSWRYLITSLFFTHQNKQHMKNKGKVRVSSRSICRYFSLFWKA